LVMTVAPSHSSGFERVLVVISEFNRGSGCPRRRAASADLAERPSGIEEAAEPVGIEPAEPMAGSSDLLDDQVQPFGRPVGGAGGMLIEDLSTSAAQGSDPGSESRGLRLLRSR
jgi:hypothetical protein